MTKKFHEEKIRIKEFENHLEGMIAEFDTEDC